MSAPLVRCDCGWEVPEGVVPGVPAGITIAPHVAEMIRHWQDGHVLQCRAEIRHQVRSTLKRYRQLQRAYQRGGLDEDLDEVKDRIRRAFTGDRQPKFTSDPWD